MTLKWTAPWTESPLTLDLAAVQMQRILQGALGELVMTGWLFLGHAPWQPRSRLVEYKRIWKSLAGRFDLTQLQTGEEIRIESADGIRFAALARVASDGVAPAIAICRAFQDGCLILAPASPGWSLASEQLFAAAFPSPPGGRPERISTGRRSRYRSAELARSWRETGAWRSLPAR